jgi:hypothetical protein
MALTLALVTFQQQTSLKHFYMLTLIVMYMRGII